MIRVFIGGQLAPNLYYLSDEELISLAQIDIATYLGIKIPAIKTWLSRWQMAYLIISSNTERR